MLTRQNRKKKIVSKPCRRQSEPPILLVAHREHLTQAVAPFRRHLQLFTQINIYAN